LILFVKAPVPGRVKTRLVPPLTALGASQLYRDWSRAILESARRLEDISTEVAYEPHPDIPTPRWLDEGEKPISYFLQEGNYLGERLLNAFRRAFSAGCKRVVIIGSDSPGLPSNYIQEAFESLGSNDCVLGPTQDGGYYLIGLSQKAVPELFQGISWSTQKVFSQTLEKALSLNLRFHVLPGYFDIDRPEDLQCINQCL
jgi:rSAM/selenodomain-associated transferase 1